MNVLESLPYSPGKASSGGVLGRFLPPIEAGSVSSWLTRNIPPGAWLLDPFGASPHLVIEAARAGYRILVASNNPIDRFLISLFAQPPTKAELQAALADLGAAHKGDQRIEPHILSLYLTICNQCQHEISAQAFIWERGAEGPEKRVYHCLNCSHEDDSPTTKFDGESSAHFSSSGLYRARALERVSPVDDVDRASAEEALETYLPRTLYALFNLLNKLDSLPEHHRRPLSAMLLFAFDQTNSLWPYPSVRTRPRQLAIPSHFREKNVWLALEEGLNYWTNLDAATEPPIPAVNWPEEPPESGGILIYPGRVRDLKAEMSSEIDRKGASLTDTIKDIRFAAALTAIPRPNQAYWTLSALWSGWLWDKETVAPFRSVLRRRRYDWAWHTAALNAALSNTIELLEPTVPFLGWIAEAEPGYISSSLISAKIAGFDLNGISLRDDQKQAQVFWIKPADRGAGRLPKTGLIGTTPLELQNQVAEATLDYLVKRGEPASFLQIHTAALASNFDSLPAPPTGGDPADLYSDLHNNIQQAFNYRLGFVRFGGSSSSLDVGKWWLNEAISTDETSAITPKVTRTINKKLILPSTSDQVEIALVNYLYNNPGTTTLLIDREICQSFPGLLTPDNDLVTACLTSYGEKISMDQDSWRLRTSDSPESRRADLKVIIDLVIKIGGRLGYQVTQPTSKQRMISWVDEEKQEHYHFHIVASAVIDHILAKQAPSSASNIIVYPGSRASLIEHKLRDNPRLKAIVDSGWKLIKFRHVRRMFENEQLNRSNLNEQLTLDPITNQDAQMALL